jgi:hypothetical protein
MKNLIWIIVLLAIIGSYFYFVKPDKYFGEAVPATFALEGLWVSSDDENFTREFKEDGIVIDGYIGEEDTVGTWEYITDPTAESVDLPEMGDAPIVKLLFEVEAFYFSVVPEGTDKVSMAYLNGNGVLTFTRVTE